MDLAILAPYLAGAIGVPLTNYLKDKLDWGGQKALWLSAGVSLVLGVGALALAGGLVLTPAGIFDTFAQAFAAATIIYKTIAKVSFKA